MTCKDLQSICKILVTDRLVYYSASGDIDFSCDLVVLKDMQAAVK